MTTNFMVSDLIGTVAGVAIFPLFIVLPGYVLGWIIDALGFRQRSILARLAISVCLSIGASPVLAYTFWRCSPFAVWAFFCAIWTTFIVLLWRERHVWFATSIRKERGLLLGVVIAWVGLGIFSVIDLQFKKKLYFSLLAYDYTFRSAVVAAINRSGIPPNNPYFFPGRPFPLRYHYFWSIICSLVSEVGGFCISPRQAVMSGTIWSGIGLIAVIPVYLRFFQPRGAEQLNRRVLIAWGLLSVTGLNIVLITFAEVLTHNIVTTSRDIFSWAAAVLWVPHHVAALVAALTGFLLVYYRREIRGRSGDVLATVGAGLMFAGALGLSVYVTLVFAVFSTIWLAICCFRRELREALLISLAGLAALVFCTPYILELLGARDGQGATGGPFLQLAVRSFTESEALLAGAGLGTAALKVLLLPLNYGLDLGFFAVVGVLYCGRIRRSKDLFAREDICGLTMALTSLVLCTFLRSGVIAVNDLGIRGIMVAQFILLIWGAELLNDGLLRAEKIERRAAYHVRLGRDGRSLVKGMLVLGLAGTLNDLFVLRALPILQDATAIPRVNWLSHDHELGSRTYAMRRLYEALKQKLPRNAVLQQNPNTNPGDLFYGLYADRQTAAETLACGTVFGGSPLLCAQIIGPIDNLFEKPQGIDTVQVERICKRLSIDALVVKDTDPAWADTEGWVWKKTPVLANAHARAYLCESCTSAP